MTTESRGARRSVTVRLERRCVRIGTGEVLVYPGILLIRRIDGTPVARTWLPVGEDPSDADDEHLIRELHEALLWQSGWQADPPLIS
ncbi:hypothetical protein [Amycolatopsis sp. CA-230715]|uniref:hypothetical protein n=1 Tax=Amycolatopsis sp. CA-230715 TaxID=2745196 RepID=UPI001C01FF63|nr:hypothetical protein [Amycolatopsis sp. CA-230715]QWF78373.1 hypothetical protein HUW46_01768 [Amycolatopsis sp. CA-230715]